MSLRNWIALLAVAPATALAWGDECDFRADRAAAVDTRGVEKVVIQAGAGDLNVTGRANAARIEARGTACADSQAMLDAAQIVARREGNVVYLETKLPQDDENFSWGKNKYARIDVSITLPVNIAVEAQDSSGDAQLEDLKSLQMLDSSGDLEIFRIAGLVDVQDSSGDLTIRGAGSVRAQDSSGDLGVDEVRGDVDVTVDSSGDIQIAHVTGNVRIQQDSSGGIRIEEVKGSVTVDADSSGDIFAGRVGGDFTVSSDSSGNIEHESIGGHIRVPHDESAH
jgi:DUF4097 and DUF4098 domain-containing protein YvlB